eukprot:CAMPEP_0194067466 /NCGR_PEP_ID=MMETSP0009_2-20130614/86572_1 /TAXON_ID=210454 /ORGANISM="Grammatophora oceanica, Strain CCMP 410" /LENGTH=571 /DNA_ID=CAMNT_0038720493 /DNA_START=90 /DNA_END=1805 /DNA_ORIENTATION=+
MSLSSSPSKRSATSKMARTTVHMHWFRLMDLRLHDNPALTKACDEAATDSSGADNGILPVFCFDPRIFGNDARTRDFGSVKCGPKRAKFILESVQDLRKRLEDRGSGLLVTQGKPEDVLCEILKEVDPNKACIPHVTCQTEVCSEELSVDKTIRASLTKEHHPKSILQTIWGSTLYDPDDLPFPNGAYDVPNVFTPFRNKVEKNCKIGAPLPVPTKRKLQLVTTNTDSSKLASYLERMPTLKDLGYTDEQVEEAETYDDRGVMNFRGGETAALARVQDYIWDKDLLKVYFDTRNGMIGPDYSTKLAPWLAHGNVSPRYVAHQCQKYERERVENKSTYWVVFELLWRDFFKFFAMKHGDNIFFQSGTTGSDNDKKWGFDPRHFQAWKEGRTGYPLVDANMRELKATGFMSNRGRQNVCSFLALDMNTDWRHGADYFESTLLDYDVHSNWGNWCSGAGMTGGRINRFNIVKQSKDYDQHGDYVRHWLPELRDVPTEFVHEPWKMNQFQQMEYGCKLGVDYPNPIVPPFYPKQQGGGGRKNGRGAGRNRGKNPNRGRGQRQDMKSLPKGHIRMK